MSAFFSNAHTTAVKDLTAKIKAIDAEITSRRLNIRNARYQPDGLNNIPEAIERCDEDIKRITRTINTLKTPPWENVVNQIRQLFYMLPLSSTSQRLKTRIAERTKLASVRSDLKQLKAIDKHLSYKRTLTNERDEMQYERATRKKAAHTTQKATTAATGLFATPKRLWDKLTKEKPSHAPKKTL
jgi:hypothetical protein